MAIRGDVCNTHKYRCTYVCMRMETWICYHKVCVHAFTWVHEDTYVIDVYIHPDLFIHLSTCISLVRGHICIYVHIQKWIIVHVYICHVCMIRSNLCWLWYLCVYLFVWACVRELQTCNLMFKTAQALDKEDVVCRAAHQLHFECSDVRALRATEADRSIRSYSFQVSLWQ